MNHTTRLRGVGVGPDTRTSKFITSMARGSALGRVLSRGPAILEHTNAHLDVRQAERVVDALLSCAGRRYFTGLGKSGLAAARMASSLTSIGVASQWVHGAEWSHGEHGAIRRGDLIVGVSHSGTTAEMVALADHAASVPLDFIAITGHAESVLASRAPISLACAVPQDEELLAVLPSASVIATHHVFNAILAECAARLELTTEDIGRYHPGGSIGHSLAADLTR